KAIDYGVLERDVQSSKQIYESLLQRAKETGVSRELKTSNIRVVDAAERPREPASPRKLLNLTLALFGGSLVAVGLAFFFEYVDSRIKTPEEIRTHLGLVPLGMVPAIEPGSWQGNGPLICNGVPPGFAEAIRAIRTNVLFSSAAEGARTLVITSTAPGEGKTLIAANLAIGLAQAGQRVLLIDADMRCPRLHDMFKQKQEPGLSNLMVGHAAPSACIRKSNVIGLWLLTSARVPPDPGGAARLAVFEGLHPPARGALRFRDHGFPSSPRRYGRRGGGRLGDRRRVRHRRRDDQPPIGKDCASATGERASALPWRC